MLHERTIFNEEEPLFIKAPASTIPSRGTGSFFAEELGKNLAAFIPGGTLQARQPLESPPLSLGLETLGLLPFGALAKPVKKIFPGVAKLAEKEVP